MSFLELLATDLRRWEDGGLRRNLRHIDGPQRELIRVDGREVVNFSSNNYLGLAAAAELTDAAVRALHEEGIGASSSRLISGNLAAHRRLEVALARFHGSDAALLFNSGYQANIGLVSALATSDATVFSDALNHASIIDGCRLAQQASIQVYRHRDVDHLAQLLADTPATRRRFIITETVFSMDGDIAPLAELSALARASSAVLIVDEAHAVGVFGPHGRGLCAQLNVKPDILVGTLGKALGCSGAYVAGGRLLIDYLMNMSRSFIFSTAPPPSIAAAAAAAIELVASPAGDRLRQTLADRIVAFARGLSDLRLLPRATWPTPIFPIVVGDPVRTMQVSEALLSLGIFAHGIRPPTVPPGSARLRFALMATHSDAHLASALEALSSLVRRGLLNEPCIA